MRKTTTPESERAGPRSGIVVLDKPAGLTSHQVVARVRRIAGTRKVGHAGTLDPMATGVLVVGIERATRLLGHLTLADKEYMATIRLGVSTVTDDAEGEVTARRGAGAVSMAMVEHQLGALRGDILQTPSSVSAIKVNGVRSYARVRSGEDVTLVPRRVIVSRLDVLQARCTVADDLPVLDVDVLVECSAGTYVRALARDVGARLGVGGHLTALRRTRVGQFTLAESQTLEAAASALTVTDISDVARRCFATLTLDEDQAERVTHGRRLAGVRLPAATTALLTRSGQFLALYRPSDDDAVPISVFTT